MGSNNFGFGKGYRGLSKCEYHRITSSDKKFAKCPQSFTKNFSLRFRVVKILKNAWNTLKKWRMSFHRLTEFSSFIQRVQSIQIVKNVRQSCLELFSSNRCLYSHKKNPLSRALTFVLKRLRKFPDSRFHTWPDGNSKWKKKTKKVIMTLTRAHRGPFKFAISQLRVIPLFLSHLRPKRGRGYPVHFAYTKAGKPALHGLGIPTRILWILQPIPRESFAPTCESSIPRVPHRLFENHAVGNGRYVGRDFFRILLHGGAWILRLLWMEEKVLWKYSKGVFECRYCFRMEAL